MSTTKKINDGLIKLTRENISQGHLRETIRNIPGSDKVLSDEDLVRERRKGAIETKVQEDFINSYQVIK